MLGAPRTADESDLGNGDSIEKGINAAVWPKNADDFAFSQAGDDDEYQSFVQQSDGGLGSSPVDHALKGK